MYGVIVKVEYTTKAVVHEIAGPGPKGIIRPGDVVSCDIFAYAYMCVLKRLSILQGNLKSDCRHFEGKVQK